MALALTTSACTGAGGGSTLALGLAAHSFGSEGFGGLSAEIEEDGRVRQLTSADFRRTESNRSPHTRAFEVGERGLLQVRGVLAEGNDTVAQGEITIELRPNSRWNVDFERGGGDPMLKCFGCLESRRFEIAPHRQRVAGEALWITTSVRRPAEKGVVN